MVVTLVSAIFQPGWSLDQLTSSTWQVRFPAPTSAQGYAASMGFTTSAPPTLPTTWISASWDAAGNTILPIGSGETFDPTSGQTYWVWVQTMSPAPNIFLIGQLAAN